MSATNISEALSAYRQANPEVFHTGVDDFNVYSAIISDKDTPSETKHKLATLPGTRELVKKGAVPVSTETTLKPAPETISGQSKEFGKGLLKQGRNIAVGMTANLPRNAVGLVNEMSPSKLGEESLNKIPNIKDLPMENVSQAAGGIGADLISVAIPVAKLAKLGRLADAIGELPGIGKAVKAFRGVKNLIEAKSILSETEQAAKLAVAEGKIESEAAEKALRPLRQQIIELQLEETKLKFEQMKKFKPIENEIKLRKRQQSLESGNQRMKLAEQSGARADVSLANRQYQQSFQREMSQLRESRISAKLTNEEARKFATEKRAIATSDAPIGDKLRKAKELKAEIDTIKRQKALSKLTKQSTPKFKGLKKSPTPPIPGTESTGGTE